MAKSPLILAALAKDAVPHVDFNLVKNLTTGLGGSFDTALLTATTGEHYVIRVANTHAASVERDVELRALKAIGASERAQLPFKITNLVGETKDSRGQRALIFKFVYGNPIEAGSVSPQSSLALSMGESIAAIHNLPLSVVQDAHLAEFEPADIIRARVADLDRAAETSRVPSVLLSRWEAAFEDANLFHFQSTVIHGSLGTDTALELDGLVSGVLAWSSLKISDPAEDLAWIVGAGNHELTDTVLTRYGQLRAAVDPTIRQRATLYSELEMAKWLVHGVNKGNQGIIDDAMSMLTVLAEDVESGAIGRLVAAPLAAATATIIAAEALAPEGLEVIEVIEVVEFEEIQVVELEEVESANSEPVDLATRPIELPEKSEDELF